MKISLVKWNHLFQLFFVWGDSAIEAVRYYMTFHHTFDCFQRNFLVSSTRLIRSTFCFHHPLRFSDSYKLMISHSLLFFMRQLFYIFVHATSSVFLHLFSFSLTFSSFLYSSHFKVHSNVLDGIELQIWSTTFGLYI